MQTMEAYWHPANLMACGRGACSVGGCSCPGALLFSWHHAGHTPTLVCAATASLRAFLAMRHRMFGAFLATRFTNVRAGLAKGAGHFAAARHVSRSQSANLRTIHIERNTPGHRFWILFLQAGYRAMVTCVSTVITGFDAGLELLMRHGLLQKNEAFIPCKARTYEV